MFSFACSTFDKVVRCTYLSPGHSQYQDKPTTYRPFLSPQAPEVRCKLAIVTTGLNTRRSEYFGLNTMTYFLPLALGTVLLAIAIYRCIIEPLYTSPLSKIPGPRAYALTRWRLAWDEYRGHRTRAVHELHARYGPVVRIGPNEVHFNTPSALHTIYGAGSGFGRTDFYRMFDAYGKQNVFTFGPSSQHAERKRLLASAYAKGSVIKGRVAEEVERKVEDYLKLVEDTGERGDEIFRSLHYFSLDNITNFLYGPHYGGTMAMQGDRGHQALLDDILDPDRRKLTWCVVHFPSLVKWLYSRTGWIERLVAPFLPMQKPSTYTRIRAHALTSMQDYKEAVEQGQVSAETKDSVIDRLWTHHQDRKKGGLDDLDVAAECSDHLLAGIDTTADTLMFLLWALSRPENRKYQDKVIEEARHIPETGLNESSNPTVEAADKLPYLDAVIKETLRLYAPLPASEPRSPPKATMIDGYYVPAGTAVSMAPYSLHRNPDIFPDPLKWDPERWLTDDTARLMEMKKWWWAFSSGGRMCIGMHLAMAEMVALVPAIYRLYETSIKEGFEGVTPGITSRFEVFYDERIEKMEVSNSMYSEEGMRG